jgi:hypothetical protein
MTEAITGTAASQRIGWRLYGAIGDAMNGFAMGNIFGGFILPMCVGYIFLRLAGSPKRKPSTAGVLRAIAMLLAAILVYANYRGSGQVNLGGVAAVVVVIAWGIWQIAHTSPAANSEA